MAQHPFFVFLPFCLWLRVVRRLGSKFAVVIQNANEKNTTSGLLAHVVSKSVRLSCRSCRSAPLC